MRISDTKCTPLIVNIAIFAFSVLILLPVQAVSADARHFDTGHTMDYTNNSCNPSLNIGSGSYPYNVFVSINVSPVSGLVPLTVHFDTAYTVGSVEIENMTWDFGDGNQTAINLASPNITHTYQKAGNYSAVLEVTYLTMKPQYSIQNLTTAQEPCAITVANLQTTPATPTLTVTTDKTSYIKRDPITISGTVPTYVPNIPVTIIVRNPAGQVVVTEQIPVESNSVYSTVVTPTTSGNFWLSAGTYSIYVQYSGQTVTTAQTTFQFSGVNGQSTPSPVVPSTPTTPSTSIQQTTSTPSSTTSTSTTIQSASTPTQPTSATSTSSTITSTPTMSQQNTTKPIAPQQLPQQYTPIQQQTLPTLQELKFPAWFNNVIIWYEQGKISNEDLFRAIQYLRHS